LKKIERGAEMTIFRHRLVYLSAVAALIFGGCAALSTGSGTVEDRIFHAGTTELELIRRLGPPMSEKTISPARRAWDLRADNAQISLLVYPSAGFDANKGSYPIPPPDSVVSEAAFRFWGRVGKNNRAAQPSFDSFMTLGLAKVYLIPKALWERASEDDAQLTVWFDSSGCSLAYKWAVLSKNPPW
jgi:hypothetical protein